MKIEPVHIHVADTLLADRHDRLWRTRWPDEIQESRWTYGTNLEYLRELATYWLEDFDWRAQEAALDHAISRRPDRRFHSLYLQE